MGNIINMKRRTKINNIYNELMAIKDDDLFLAAASSIENNVIVFLSDFRYKPLHSRVSKILDARREKYGSEREKKRQSDLIRLVGDLASKNLTKEELKEGVDNIAKQLTDSDSKAYPKEFKN